MSEKLRVLVKRTDRKGFIEFTKQLQQAHKNGFEIKDFTGKEAPRFNPFMAFLERPDGTEDSPLEDVEDSEVVDVADELETLSGKEELLAYAEKHQIEVPQEKKNPRAIKKFLKEQTSEKE